MKLYVNVMEEKMKNGFLKLALLISLVLALVLSFASCDPATSDNGDVSGAADGNKNDQSVSDSGANEEGDGEHYHTFSDWVVTRPATCAYEGERAQVCECGERPSQVIPKTDDHNYSNGKCTLCGQNEPGSGAGDNGGSGNTDKVVDTGKMDSFDYSRIPAYSGAEYVTVNENTPFFTESEKVTTSYETYGAWDSLGRCTVVEACIGRDLMPTGDRTNTSFQPTGWIQANYTFVSGGVLYNRCHLIAWSLTAETTNRQNLVTGTRYMNEAMIPFEEMTADYIKETNNHVMYRVTPIFLGDNLLCSGILLEAYSVEDEGEGICFNVFFYNVQPGVNIDYATGASSASGDIAEPEVPEDFDYILNKSSKKIHTAECGNAKLISDKNKEYYTGDIEDLIDDGYTVSGCCNPK